MVIKSILTKEQVRKKSEFKQQKSIDQRRKALPSIFEGGPLTLKPVYEIIQSEELPTFDAFTRVKDIVLCPRLLSAYNQLLKRCHKILFPVCCIGIILRLVAILDPLPIDTQNILVATSLVLTAPIYVFVVFGMCWEYVKILCSCFEVIFLTTISMAWTLSFFWYVGGTRSVLAIIIWVELMCTIFSETVKRLQKTSFLFLGLGTLGMCSWTVLVLFGWVHDHSMEDVLTLPRGHITAKDIQFNSTITIAIVFIRVTYRTYKLTKKKPVPSHAGIRSVMYRCRIRLELASPCMQVLVNQNDPVQSVKASVIRPTDRTNAVAPVVDNILLRSIGKRASKMRVMTMKLAPDRGLFFQEDVMCVVIYSFIMNHVCSTARRVRMFHAVGMLGIISTLPFMVPKVVQAYPTLANAVCTTSLILSGTFMIGCASCYHRKVLYRLATSFKFLFLWGQQLVIGMCLYYLCGWNIAVCMAMLNYVLWQQWVFTLDALLPCTKAKLMISNFVAFYIIFLGAVVSLIICLDLVWFDKGGFEHEASGWAHHELEISICPVSMLISRYVTMSVWWLQILIRLIRSSHENELLVLQGFVEINIGKWMEEWVTGKVEALDLDPDVYVAYGMSILDDEESPLEDRIESLIEIFSAATEADEKTISSVLQSTQMVREVTSLQSQQQQSAVEAEEKKRVESLRKEQEARDREKEKVEQAIAQEKEKAKARGQLSREELSQREKLITSYGFSALSEVDDDGNLVEKIKDKKQADSQLASSLGSNDNKQRVQEAQAQRRQKLKSEHDSKVAREKELLQKDKLRKEKAKQRTVKREKQRGAG